MIPCRSGKHALIEIDRSSSVGPEDAQAVVRWCEFCGAVVVDLEFDGRTIPGGIRKMVFPAVTKQLVG